jgi:DNA-binding CsgD family transcriptional regulator
MSDQTNLSDREQQILQLVATGLTNREIAQKLTISHNTVKVHLSNIFEKINVSSRTEATLYGIEHGIVDVPGVENGESQPSVQEVIKKYIWIIIPIVILALAFLVTLGRDLFFPSPTPTPVALANAPDRWQELAPMPEARKEMAVVAYDGNIYAIAGEGPEGVSGSVFRYLTEEDRWERLRDKPTPVADVEGALIGEKIYVPGGRLADGTQTDILEIYDPRQDVWEEGAPLPKPISAYATADFEGKLYLFGGWDGEKALKDVFVYDPEEDVWGERTPMATARQDLGAVALVDKIVVLGGRSGEGITGDAKAYIPSRDLDGDNPWGEFLDIPEERYNFGVASIYDTVYLIGGILGEKRQKESASWLMNGEEWIPLETNRDYNMRSTTMVSLESQLMIFEPSDSFEATLVWAYQAFYYSIYFPIVQ